MAESTNIQYGTYRCPVCGHSDGTELAAGEQHRLIRCSYCGTSLQVSARSADSVRFAAQVAKEAAAQ